MANPSPFDDRGSHSQATHGVKIGRGTVTHWNGEPIASHEMAGRALRKIEELTGERGVTTKILATLRMPGDMP